MDAINNRSINEAALKQAEEKLKKLNYVSTKIGSPEFGVCMPCGETIQVGRKRIRPESPHCVNFAMQVLVKKRPEEKLRAYKYF